MAAKRDCSACSDLQENAPEFVQNGVTTNVCNSLKNDTGFNPSSGNNDCTDLNDANDCLIGNMEDEVDAYDVCEWKEFMPKFIHNLWNVLKAMICALCGIWKMIHKHDCEIEKLFEGMTFSVHEEPSDGSYIVAGKGVSFYEISSGWHASDIGIEYYGGLGISRGSLIIHRTDFQDAKPVPNFDNGTNERTSQSRLGNSEWANVGKPSANSELLYEIRIKKSEYPELKSIRGGRGQESTNGAFRVLMQVFTEGKYAYGQHGTCDEDGSPSSSGNSGGHLVANGYIYLQIRLTYADVAFHDGGQYSPTSWCGIRLTRGKIEC